MSKLTVNPELLKIFKIDTSAKPCFVSVVGAGGKTSLSHALVKATTAEGRNALQMPTAHLGEGQALEPVYCGHSSDILDRVFKRFKEKSGLYASLVASDTANKYEGILPDNACRIFGKLASELDREFFSLAVAEADGARNLDFKAPASHELLMPSCTTHVIVCSSMKSFGRSYDHDRVHRPEEVNKYLKPEDKNKITADLLGRIATDDMGYGYCYNASLSIYLSHADEGEVPEAEIVEKLLAFKRIDRVVCCDKGQLFGENADYLSKGIRAYFKEK